MPLPKPHFVYAFVRIAINRYRIFRECEPRLVLVGLMDMAALEQRLGQRAPGDVMRIDGVPVAVGGLEEMTRCVA